MADWFEGAVGGATAGASIGGPWGAAVGGLLGGIFGKKKKPKVPTELKRLYDVQFSMADQLRRFAQSPAMSDRLEQTQLADARARLGEQQSVERNQVYSLYNPQQGTNAGPNLLTNIYNQQQGQQMALNAQHMLAALQNRRQALVQASGIGANAANAVSYQQEPSVDLAGAFGSLAQAIAQNRGMNQARAARQQAEQDANTQKIREATGTGGVGENQHAGPDNQTEEWNPTAAIGSVDTGGGAPGGSVGGFNPGGGVYGEPQSENPYAATVLPGPSAGALQGGWNLPGALGAQKGSAGMWDFRRPRGQGYRTG